MAVSLALPVLRSPAAVTTTTANLPSSGVFDHFAGAPFLEPLIVRLRGGEIGNRLEREIEGYLAERDALGAEILAQMPALGGTADANSLRALAERQAERLESLERTAELLRQKLVEGSRTSGGFDPFEARTWRRTDRGGAEATAFTLAEEATLARRVAAYAAGLSGAQRRLLREAADDLRREPLPEPRAASEARPRLGPAVRAEGAREVVSFFPEQVRIELPVDLPAELAAELRAIDELKRGLKQELLDTVYFNDRHPEAQRRDAFAELAVVHAPRIAELERRAEVVRPRLVRWFFAVTDAESVGIPEPLRTRITNYRAAKRELQIELQRNVAAVDPRAEPLNPLRPQSETEAQKRRAQALAEAARSQAERLQHLTEEETAIRNALAKLASVGPMPAASLDGLLMANQRRLRTERALLETRAYRAAAVMPGLSSAQRRLLLGVAVLDQRRKGALQPEVDTVAR